MSTQVKTEGAALSSRKPRDDRIAQSAASQLRESAYHPLWYLSCDCRNGVLTLYGRLPSFYLKQLAQSSVGQLRDVREVINRIEVTD